MQREIRVAEPEPRLAADRLERSHEVPGFVAPAPALFRVSESGKRVERSVDVGRNVKAQMFEIVTGVDEGSECAGRKHTREAAEQPGPAHSARKSQNAYL